MAIKPFKLITECILNRTKNETRKHKKKPNKQTTKQISVDISMIHQQVRSKMYSHTNEPNLQQITKFSANKHRDKHCFREGAFCKRHLPQQTKEIFSTQRLFNYILTNIYFYFL